MDSTVQFLELRKDRGKNVQARGLAGANRDLCAGRMIQLAHAGENMTVALQTVFRKGLEQPARCGEGHLTSLAVKQPRAYFIFKRTNLRRDRRLCDAQLFRRSGKTFQ